MPPSPTSVEAAWRIIEFYRQRIQARQAGPEDKGKVRKIERTDAELRPAALRAEHEAIFSRARYGELDSEMARKLVPTGSARSALRGCLISFKNTTEGEYGVAIAMKRNRINQQ